MLEGGFTFDESVGFLEESDNAYSFHIRLESNRIFLDLISIRHCGDPSSQRFAEARAVALPPLAEMVGQEHPCSAGVVVRGFVILF